MKWNLNEKSDTANFVECPNCQTLVNVENVSLCPQCDYSVKE